MLERIALPHKPAARKSCLLLVRHLPWPVTAGGRLRDWQNVSVLSKLTELSVVALQGQTSSLPPLDHQLRLWISLDAELARNPLAFESTEKVLRSDWWNEPDGHPADHLWSPFRASALRRILAAHQFDLAIIEDITFWRYASIIEESCPVVFDCHNVQSKLEEEYLREIPEDRLEERVRRTVAISTMKYVEQRFKHCPMIVCSEQEKVALEERGVTPDHIAVIHNTLDWSSEDSRTVGQSASPANVEAVAPVPKILFPGVLNYLPNISAALQLIKKIFPAVRLSIPAAQLWIVGMSPTSDLLFAARNQPNVFVVGEVDDTSKFFGAATVVSVPLTIGGGTRFKILEAFRYGVPVVSSEKGCEGLEVTHDRHLLIARSPTEHTNFIVELACDPVKRFRLVKEGRLLLKRRYSLDTAEEQWREFMDRFFSDVPDSRSLLQCRN